MAPEDSSTPLQTMSYWIALMDKIVSRSAGSSARKSSTAMFGMENGLWEKSILFSSSFHSYIGKSTIQQNSKRSFAIRPSSSPILPRAAPASLAAAAGLSTAKNTQSPALNPVLARILCSTSAGTNLAIGPLPPSLSNTIYPRPDAPMSERAHSLSLSNQERG